MSTIVSHKLTQAGALACLLAQPLIAQAPVSGGAPVLHAAIAASEHRSDVPAIAWLCDEFLPALPQWPEGLDSNASFSLSLTDAGLQISKTKVVVPTGAVAIGTCNFGGTRTAQQIVWRCDTSGREQWSVPSEFVLPKRWQQLLHAFAADLIGTSRTLSVPVIVGHLAGGLLDNDPRSALLRLGPSLCGEATWLAQRNGNQLHVVGRSDGGLMLPMTFIGLAVAGGHGSLPTISLRAFAARDPDRAEAARQLGRADRTLDTDTLRALLHAEDETRFAAIEALVRHQASNELPAIIRAADDQYPWATIAARDAVMSLWPATTAVDRDRIQSALQASNSAVLNQLDIDVLTASSAKMVPTSRSTNPTPTFAADGRAHALTLLFFMSAGLLGLWHREHVKLRAAKN